ncbi:Uncharacterised protein [Mycobacteroides abscessus subsp. abscessus]|nr:Uncharacterised protein [Mycobacteroides abscessus subsp. abscessus]
MSRAANLRSVADVSALFGSSWETIESNRSWSMTCELLGGVASML